MDSLKVEQDKQNEVKSYLEDNAPIGYTSITVNTCSINEISIDISCTLNQGYNLTQAKQEIKIIIDKYFKENIAFVKEKITYLDIATLIHNSHTISSISTLNINGGTTDIDLSIEEVPNLHELIITEV